MIEFEYKCRLCGKKFRGIQCNGGNEGINEVSKAIANSYTAPENYLSPSLYSIHSCGDGHGDIGIGDLQGAKVIQHQINIK